VNVIQVSGEASSTTCPHCGAEVAADQRYCLACGQPCSPVRLAFLDVLQAESAQHFPSTLPGSTSGYLPPAPPDLGVARLGRYSGLFGLIAILLLTGVIGLLVGHWVSGGSSSSKGPTVYKIEGLSGTTSSAPSSEEAATEEASASTAGEGKSQASATTKAKTKAGAAKNSEPVSEAKETQEAKLPEAKKVNKKLSKLSGQAYSREIEKEVKGPEPLETE
jgi:zinc-ribbon domain